MEQRLRSLCKEYVVDCVSKYSIACTDFLKNTNKFILDVCLYVLYKDEANHELFVKQVKKLSFMQGISFLNRAGCVSSSIHDFALDVLCIRAISNDLISQFEFRAIIFPWICVNVKHSNFAALVKRITKMAKSSEHIYSFIQCLGQKKIKFRNRIILELYINAITMDLNNLENLKCVKAIDCLLISEFEKYISQKYIQLAELLKSYKNYVRECLLTAFSLNPCMEIYNKLAKSPLRKNHASALFSISGSQYMGFPKYNEYESPNLILDSAFSDEISETAREDLTRIINSPRIKTLSWSFEWYTLKIECEKLMTGDRKMELIKQNYALANKDLKYCHLSKAKESFRNYNYLAKRAKEKSWSDRFPMSSDDEDDGDDEDEKDGEYAEDDENSSTSDESMDFEGFSESELEESAKRKKIKPELEIIDVDDNDLENWSHIIKTLNPNSITSSEPISDESTKSSFKEEIIVPVKQDDVSNDDDRHFFKSLKIPFPERLTAVPVPDENKLKSGTKVILSPINQIPLRGNQRMLVERPLFTIKNILPTEPAPNIIKPFVKLEKLNINAESKYTIPNLKPLLNNNQIQCKKSFVRLTSSNNVRVVKFRQLKLLKVTKTGPVIKFEDKKKEVPKTEMVMRLCLTRCKPFVKENIKAQRLNSRNSKTKELKIKKHLWKFSSKYL